LFQKVAGAAQQPRDALASLSAAAAHGNVTALGHASPFPLAYAVEDHKPKACFAKKNTASAGEDTTSASDTACPADMRPASETDATSPLQRIAENTAFKESESELVARHEEALEESLATLGFHRPRTPGCVADFRGYHDVRPLLPHKSTTRLRPVQKEQEHLQLSPTLTRLL